MENKTVDCKRCGCNLRIPVNKGMHQDQQTANASASDNAKPEKKKEFCP